MTDDWFELLRALHLGEVRGLRLAFLGREAFVRNKRATGRPKDLADLESLGEGGV